MARIVLATIGSLGDLHPFIAIGRALVARGERVVLAVPEDGLAKARAAGLEAVAIFPSYASICVALGMSQEEVAAKVIADTDFILDHILMPTLGESARALDAAAEGADVMAGSTFALSAEIVAEKRRTPFATVLLQPMTLFSAWTPPAAPRFGIMRHEPRTGMGRAWNRVVYALARASLRRRYAARIDAVRREHGLAPGTGTPLFDGGPAGVATLCCWSRELGPLPPDAPRGSALVGFPFFDSDSGAEEALAPELTAFVEGGEAPLVFTLGSVAVASAGQFYEEAVAASRALGRRAVMLTGQPGPARVEGDCLFIGYAPHSLLFRHAAAVVHHGGVGTTGQALRAGRPQIVVPHFGDQFDNAARLRRIGLAATIRRQDFREAVAAPVIASVLADAAMVGAARRVSDAVAGEDGAGEAARRIAALDRSPAISPAWGSPP